MNEFLQNLAKIAVLIFVVTSMAAAGLGLSFSDLIAPFRRVRMILFALIANFVLSPAIAYALVSLFPIDPSYAIGLILLGVAAGAPFLPKLAELAKGDVAFSIGMMLLLTVGTIIFLPILLPILIPGQSADPWPILRSLLATMLLPLGMGIGVRGKWGPFAERIRPIFGKFSNVTVLLAVLLLIGLNFEDMIGTFGTGAVAVAILYVAILLGIGYILGGPSIKQRSVFALGTSQRNIAAALVVATQNSSDPKVTVMLLVATFAGLFVLLPAARQFARLSLLGTQNALVVTQADSTGSNSPGSVREEVTR